MTLEEVGDVLFLLDLAQITAGSLLITKRVQNIHMEIL